MSFRPTEHFAPSGPTPQPGGETPPNGSYVGADTSPNMELSAASGGLPVARLKHYQLLELIGRGGMGDVYRARDEMFDRIAAVKVLPPDLAQDETFVRRFQREAKAIAGLSHPHIVPVYDIDEDQGFLFFAMQFVEGESLDRRLRRVRRLPLSEALRIVVDCLSALETAHNQGLIHRDVKPGNVLLQHTTDHVFVVDFGLVRRIDDHSLLTVTGMVMGTVDYMAPEQARGAKQIDARADLYSVGAMLYHLLAGQLPFASQSFTSMLYSHAYESPTPLDEVAPDLPREVVALVHQLLEKDPQKRPANCRAVLDVLEPFRNLNFRTRQMAVEVERVVATESPAASVAALTHLPQRDDLWRRWQDSALSACRLDRPEWLGEMRLLAQQLQRALSQQHERHERLLLLREEGRQVLVELNNLPASPEAPDDRSQHTQPLRQQLADLEQAIAVSAEEQRTISRKRDVLDARLARFDKRRNHVVPYALPIVVVLLLVAIVIKFGLSPQEPPPQVVVPPRALKDPLQPAVPEKAIPADVFLDDLPETFVHVGHGSLGKHGSTGFEGASGETPLVVVVSGKKVTHSLSSHPGRNDPATVRYELGGKYRSFTTRVGLIDKLTVGRFQGEMIFRVLGDGRELWRSTSIREHGQSIGTSIDVAGVQRLSLVVDCLGPYHCGWAVWLEPRLSATAIGDSWHDLLANVDIERDRVFGTIQREQDGIRFLSDQRTLLTLPADWPTQYDVEFEFSRQGHGGGMELVLPVGDRLCNVYLGGWENSRHGIYRIQGQDHFPGAFCVGAIEAGKRHRATVQVRQSEATATIVLWLNSEKVVAWTGNVGDLSLHEEFELAQPGRVSASTCFSDITLQSARWRAATDLIEKATPKEDAIYRKLEPGESIELLPLAELPEDVVFGNWRHGDAGSIFGAINVNPFKGHARLQFPVRPHGDYELTFRYTILNGHDVNVVFPAGRQSARAIFGFNSGPEGSLVSHNGGDKLIAIPGAVPSTNGTRKMHEARIVVRSSADSSAIQIYVDGTVTCDWQGENRLLANNPPCQINDPRAIGVTTCGEPGNQFHAVSLKMLSGHADIGREQLVLSTYLEGPVEPLTAAISFASKEKTAHQRRAMWYAARQLWKEARADLEQAHHCDQKDTDIHADLAIMSLLLDNDADYHRRCDELEAALPAQAEGHVVIRALALKPNSTRQPQMWQEKMQAQLVAKPDHFRARILLAWTHYRNGQWNECVAAVDARVPDRPGQLYQANLLLFRGMALHQLKRHAEAKKVLADVKSFVESISPQPSFNSNVQREQVLEAFALDSMHIQILYREASQLINGKREELRLVPAVPSPKIGLYVAGPPVSEGMQLAMGSEIAWSSEKINALVEVNPSDASAFLKRCHWYAVRYRVREARADLERVVAMQPDELSFRADLAAMCSYLEDSEAYAAQSEVLHRRLPGEARPWKVYMAARSILLSDSAKFDFPMIRDEITRRMKPDESVTHKRFVPISHYRCGNWQACVDGAENISPQGPNSMWDSLHWVYRAMALHRLDRIDEAKASLETVKKVAEGERGPYWSAKAGGFHHFFNDALHVQVVYREASALILRERQELNLTPIAFPDAQPEVAMLQGPSNIYGPLENLNVQIAAQPANGKLYCQRSLWFAAREQWKESLLDAEKCLALEPRWYNRTDLARLYLNLGDRDRYEQLCRELLKDIDKEPKVGAKCGSFRPLYLEPALWQKEIEAFAPIAETMHAREPQQDEVRRTVIATRYRQGRWKECIEAAETMQPAGPTDMNGGYPWLFRIMAMHQLGQTAEAKAALQEWKTLIERLTPADFIGDWMMKIAVDGRLQMFLHNGREAQILYREASQLILRKPEELRLQPVVLPAPGASSNRQSAVEAMRLEQAGELGWSKEKIDALVDANPNKVSALQQRYYWNVIRFRWQEARADLDRIISMLPGDVYLRSDLATLCLVLEDQAAYATHCEILQQRLTAEPVAWKVYFAAMSLSLNDAKGIDYPKLRTDATRRLQPLARDLRQYLPLAHFRCGDWQDCLEAADGYAPKGPGRMSDVTPWIYRAMALYRLDRIDEAKASLTELKAFAEAQRGPYSWKKTHFESFFIDALYAQIAYREASTLILGRREELQLVPVNFSTPPAETGK